MDGIAITYRAVNEDGSYGDLHGPVLMWDERRADYVLDNGDIPERQALAIFKRQHRRDILIAATRMALPD